jgi:hypothetical protein
MQGPRLTGLSEGKPNWHMAGYDDDDDWVGEPPEGRYTRDRAKPEFWQRPWPLAGAGTALLIIIVVVVVLATR